MSQRGQTSRAQWLRRLALRRDHKTCFVFSGGGPLAALQVGATLALFDHGIRPDLVVGTSAGALNATLIAYDPTPGGVRTLEQIWRRLSDEDLFPGGRFRASWTRMLRRGDRVFDNSGIARLIDGEGLTDALIEEAAIPLGVVATDLETGDEVVFRNGRLREALMASSAMPSVFPPVDIEGRRYIDGGVADNVPIKPALDMGAETLYVMNSTSHTNQRRPLVRPMDYLLHAFTLARSQRFVSDVDRYSQRAQLIILPASTLDFFVPFASMEFTGQLIERAYEDTSRYLEAHAKPGSQLQAE